jgi:hypothetical protein
MKKTAQGTVKASTRPGLQRESHPQAAPKPADRLRHAVLASSCDLLRAFVAGKDSDGQRVLELALASLDRRDHRALAEWLLGRLG